MISFMIVRWGLPVYGGSVLFMVVGLFLGLFAPGLMSGIMSSVNGFFDFIFLGIDLVLPKSLMIESEEWTRGSAETGGILSTQSTEFGMMFDDAHRFFTSLPTYGNGLVGATMILYFSFEIIAFWFIYKLSVRNGRKVSLNQSVDGFADEASDGSWVMGGKKKK